MDHVSDHPPGTGPIPTAVAGARTLAASGLLSVLVLLAGCGAPTTPVAPRPGAAAVAHDEEPPVTPSSSPEPPPRRRFVSIATSSHGACALDDAGALVCWGESFGETPQPIATGVEALLGVLRMGGSDRNTPIPSACRLEHGVSVDCGPATGHPIRALVDFGWINGCAVLADRTIECWGNRAVSTSGDGPVHPIAGLSGVASAGLGWRLACAVLANGELSCWGPGVLRVDGLVPIALPAAARSVATGDDHACVALVDGRVACWGHSYAFATGGAADEPAPRIVPGISGAESVAAAGQTSCAIVDGAVTCWGRALVWDDEACAQRGGSPTPQRIAGPEHVRQLSIQNGWGCALDGAGDIWCFGRSESGQLGDGTLYSAHPSSAARRIRLEPADATDCMRAANRSPREISYVVAGTQDVSFCAEDACFTVDLATGRYRAASPRASSTAGGLDDGELDVEEVGGRLEVCRGDDCVVIAPSRTLVDAERRGAIDVPSAGVIIAYAEVEADEGDRSLVLEGFARAGLARLYQQEIGPHTGSTSLHAVGPHVVASRGSFRELVDPRTGRVVRDLHRAAHDELVVFDAGAGSTLLTDRLASYVEVLAPDGASRSRALTRSERSVASLVGDALVIVRGAPMAGDVEILDVRSGAERAHFSPPLCETQLPPVDACTPSD